MTPELREMIEALKNEGASLEQVKVVIDEIEGLSAEEKAEVIREFSPSDANNIPPPIPPVASIPPPILSVARVVRPSPLSARFDALRFFLVQPKWGLAGVGVVLLLTIGIFTLWPRNSAKIVGKWRPVGGDSNQFFEFFADGKMTQGPNGQGMLVEYSLSGNELTIGPNDQNTSNIRTSTKTVVSFPDADHMDWTTEYTMAGEPRPRDSGRDSGTPSKAETHVVKQVVRFERIKEGLTVPAK